MSRGEVDSLPWEREPLPALPPVPALEIDGIRELLHSTKEVENDVSMRRQVAWARIQALDLEIGRRAENDL